MHFLFQNQLTGWTEKVACTKAEERRNAVKQTDHFKITLLARWKKNNKNNGLADIKLPGSMWSVQEMWLSLVAQEDHTSGLVLAWWHGTAQQTPLGFLAWSVGPNAGNSTQTLIPATSITHQPAPSCRPPGILPPHWGLSSLLLQVNQYFLFSMWQHIFSVQIWLFCSLALSPDLSPLCKYAFQVTINQSFFKKNAWRSSTGHLLCRLLGIHLTL